MFQIRNTLQGLINRQEQGYFQQQQQQQQQLERESDTGVLMCQGCNEERASSRCINRMCSVCCPSEGNHCDFHFGVSLGLYDEDEDEEEEETTTTSLGIEEEDTTTTSIQHEYVTTCNHVGCNNQAAAECSNGMCVDCCNHHGRVLCSRHDFDETETTTTSLNDDGDDDDDDEGDGSYSFDDDEEEEDTSTTSIQGEGEATTTTTTEDNSVEDTSTTEYGNNVSQSHHNHHQGAFYCVGMTGCRNRAAIDCDNGMCGRCCVLHGHFECNRHNTGMR